jgi:hypothetical protein
MLLLLMLLLLMLMLLLLQYNLASRYLHHYSPADLPPLLAACATLPPFCWPSKAWCVTLMSHLHPRLKTLNPRALGLTAWALGKMGLKLRGDFAGEIQAGFKAGLEGAGSREVALMVHGLAGCGWRPDALWVGVVLYRVEQQLRSYSGADLAMLLGALVKMR